MTHEHDHEPAPEEHPDPDDGDPQDDVDTAFAALIAQFSDGAPEVGPWSAAEDLEPGDTDGKEADGPVPSAVEEPKTTIRAAVFGSPWDSPTARRLSTNRTPETDFSSLLTNAGEPLN